MCVRACFAHAHVRAMLCVAQAFFDLALSLVHFKRIPLRGSGGGGAGGTLERKEKRLGRNKGEEEEEGGRRGRGRTSEV